MEKPLSEITREEWIKWQWTSEIRFGDEERYMIRGSQRTPDEAFEAMMQWDSVQEGLGQINQPESEEVNAEG